MPILLPLSWRRPFSLRFFRHEVVGRGYNFGCSVRRQKGPPLTREKNMKELEPLRMLVGRWQGKGKGSYGPFSAEMDVEERGRWLLMRQKIKIPVVGITTYVSTQIYGYNHDQLTLDFFDTSGSFHFLGNRDGDILKFYFKD